MILTHPAFKLAFVVLSPLMNPLLRKNRRAKKKKKKDATMKMESFTGIGTLQKASIERRSVGWGYRGHAVVHLRGKVSRRGPGPLMHESMHGAQNVHWHAPATLAREPSFAAQMSNANDPNETVLTLVRLSTSPRAPCSSLPLLPDAQPHCSE